MEMQGDEEKLTNLRNVLWIVRSVATIVPRQGSLCTYDLKST